VFRAVVDIEYDTLESDPGYQALPNLLLVESEPGHSRYVVSLPPGRGEVPGVVFLHGFGGLMAPYVQALADSEVGRHCAILAPILDNQGHWWEDGLDLVEDVVVNHLPPRVDPDRLYLVGLSNGAVGATLLGLGDPVGSRLRGIALISGIGPMPESPSCGTDLLVIHGLRDGRFLPWDISDGADVMRSLGSRVRQETLDGDHFLILADRAEVMAILAEWIGRIEGEVQRESARFATGLP
jgi:pimeloyl-ACP methyl ester carboxylesterase